MAEMQELSRPPGHMQDLIEGPRRSILTLATRQEGSVALQVDGLRRVREPVSRSKSTVQGKVADVFAGRSRHAESQNELKAFRAYPWPRGVRMRGRSSRSASNTIMKGPSIATRRTFWLLGASIRKSLRSRKTPTLNRQRIKRASRSSGSCSPITGFTFGSGRNPKSALNLGWRMPPWSWLPFSGGVGAA